MQEMTCRLGLTDEVGLRYNQTCKTQEWRSGEWHRSCPEWSNYLVIRVTGVRHGDFCSCDREFGALLCSLGASSFPSYSLEIKWGTVLYCLNGLNFHIPYLPRTEPKSCSDIYHLSRATPEVGVVIYPLRALPSNGRLHHAQKYLWSATPIPIFVPASPPPIHSRCNSLVQSSSSTFFSTLFLTISPTIAPFCL